MTHHLQVEQTQKRDLQLPVEPKGHPSTDENTPLQLYRADNAKLVCENNELHQMIIHMKDDFEDNIKGNKLTASVSTRNNIYFE